MAGRGRKFLRKVTPQREAAEALMQHDDRRRLVRGRPIGDGLQAFAVGEDVAAQRPLSMERRSLR